MKELFQGKIEIIELFKKYYTKVRKKEVENSTELLKELDRKTKVLNSKLNTDNSVMHIFSKYFTESEGIQLFYIRFGSYNHSAFVAFNINHCSYKKENFQCLLL